ncbi:hypothetical protein [Pseudoroseomonas sp. WGS1072]|uniref:hypothetical protein n=1 Tax=Roseomonas sp. WGS1072 TaxID=3366816 RepID=UPI003BF4464C
MPLILKAAALATRRRLLLVSTTTNGCHWARPVWLSLVMTDGTPYTRRNGKGVLRTFRRAWADSRYQGERSSYRATYNSLASDLERLAAEAGGTVLPEGEV